MPSGLTVAEWHAQFTRQAGWTRAVRSRLYRRVNLLRAGRVLDVGCGTGVITEEMAGRCRGQVIGVDVDPAMIAFAREQGGRAEYRVGDAHRLDFPAAHFDVVACHFTLLWLADPARAVREMARLCRPGGAVLACAEPDYGGRVDHPELPIAGWQAAALRREGADPFLGRKLRALFATAGLQAEVGVIPSLWDTAALQAECEAEWALLERTLAGTVDEAEIRRVRDEERAALESGARLVFVPIFYAVGRK